VWMDIFAPHHGRRARVRDRARRLARGARGRLNDYARASLRTCAASSGATGFM
jgi:hypothetical protein